jgi:cell division protease FtsH
MVNEAAINAVKCGRKAISQADLMEAVEVVIAGKEKKDRILSKKEKKIVSYHEVGHALVTALQKDAEPVQKITIVPRTMGSLGYVIQAPEEEKFLMTKDELNARLVTLLAGRASEEIVFNSVTTGASNDMEKATDIARAMIAQYGMSEKFGLMSLEKVENPYLSRNSQLNCSDKTATEIEEEVKLLLKERYEDAKKLLISNRDKLDRIAQFLYEKETITGKEFMDIFRQCENDDEVTESSQNTDGEQ